MKTVSTLWVGEKDIAVTYSMYSHVTIGDLSGQQFKVCYSVGKCKLDYTAFQFDNVYNVAYMQVFIPYECDPSICDKVVYNRHTKKRKHFIELYAESEIFDNGESKYDAIKTIILMQADMYGIPHKCLLFPD